MRIPEARINGLPLGNVKDNARKGEEKKKKNPEFLNGCIVVCPVIIFA